MDSRIMTLIMSKPSVPKPVNATSHGQRDSADVIKVIDFETEKLFQVGQI